MQKPVTPYYMESGPLSYLTLVLMLVEATNKVGFTTRYLKTKTYPI